MEFNPRERINRGTVYVWEPRRVEGLRWPYPQHRIYLFIYLFIYVTTQETNGELQGKHKYKNTKKQN